MKQTVQSRGADNESIPRAEDKASTTLLSTREAYGSVLNDGAQCTPQVIESTDTAMQLDSGAATSAVVDQKRMPQAPVGNAGPHVQDCYQVVNNVNSFLGTLSTFQKESQSKERNFDVNALSFQCITQEQPLNELSTHAHPKVTIPIVDVPSSQTTAATALDPSLSNIPTLMDDEPSQDLQTSASPHKEVDCSLDHSIIEEVNMFDPGLANHGTPDIGQQSHDDQGMEQTRPCGQCVSRPPECNAIPTRSSLSMSIADKRKLAHIHTLKQIIASKTSLVNMEFGGEEIVQAATLFDDLNSTACFYTTALRLISKADWQERVDFEEHIVHQALIAVAHGWTTAVGVKTLPFDKHYLALSMAILSPEAHGEVKRTFESIIAALPSPFKEKVSSEVTFECRCCCKKASYDVAAYIVVEPLMLTTNCHDYFNAAVPWTENLLPGAAEDLHSFRPNCHECAIDSTWTIESEAKCKLVWFQFPRDFHPQALSYDNFLGKDPFVVRGLSWRCVSVVVHQGQDPLNGANQPSDHFYVLENEGPASKFFCYNNAVGLHQVEDTKIKPGDRICALLFRTADITTKWTAQFKVANKRIQASPASKADKSKKGRNGPKSKALFSSKIRPTLGKQTLQSMHTVTMDSRNTRQDTYTFDEYGLPNEEVAILPPETVEVIEDAFSQTRDVSQATLPLQPENGDPCRCFVAAPEASQKTGNSETRPGPYSGNHPRQGANNERAVSAPETAVGTVDDVKPPYAILSMFDGCGSSIDIIESKIGYRPTAGILCEKDETLRYLVSEKLGITVDQKWQHSSKGGGAFYYANDVDSLFIDNARLLRELVALCPGAHFFVIGGSPCTDLTYAGGDQGLLGICGPASVFFFTIHLALYLLTTVVPTTHIRFLVENAGSMRNEHFRFIRGCLGLQHLQKADMTWCTSVLSPAKRLRIFFQNNTSYESQDLQVHCAADLAWPTDWSPLLLYERGILREVHLQPFMRPLRTISDLAIRYSWSSYHPTALLWRVSQWGSRDRLAHLANLSDDKGIPAFQWSSMLPPIYLKAWLHLLKVFTGNSTNKEKDIALQDVLPLFHNRNIELPCRFLTDQEVLQVSGLSQNFATVSTFRYLLTSLTIRSFVGNSFHPKLVSRAIGSSDDLREWVRGQLPSTTQIAHPDTVRKYYIQFRHGIVGSIERIKHTTKTTLEPEPYRHIDYRTLVMSPIEKPMVAQPTVGNIPPTYLTKESVRKEQLGQTTARQRAIGTPQFLSFLAKMNLSQYLDGIAVPQWLLVANDMTDALVGTCSTPLLAGYQQGLLTQPVFARAYLFLRSLAGSCLDGKAGFFLIDYTLTPIHVQYIGPTEAVHVYFFRLKETLDIMIFKYGGKPLAICSSVASCQEYTVHYSLCDVFFTNVANSVAGIALQKSSHSLCAEAPFLRTFKEPGCALWRLSQSALARTNSLDRNPFVNSCHTILAQLPLISIESKLEERQLYVLASTAQALCPDEQTSVWTAEVPYTYCLLFLYQAMPTRVGSEFECVATCGLPDHHIEIALPDQQTVCELGKFVFRDTAVDECPNMSVENGVYVCIYGESARIIFRRAQALLFSS